MARQKKDKRTEQLLAEMADSRAAIREVVEGLGQHGVTRREIAAAARWNPGYMSDFLTREDKHPTAAKIEALVVALNAFVSGTMIRPELAAPLNRVAERYQVQSTRLTNPTASQIPPTAPNYVRRADVDDSLGRACSIPGSYAIGGQPMTGISTAMLSAAEKLQARDITVCRLSATTDLMESGYLGKSKTGPLGALAAAITGSEEPLTLEFFGAQEALRTYLSDIDGDFALLIDDVNALGTSDVESVKLLLRDWATRRAAGEAPYSSTTTWIAVTSNIRDVRWHSTFIADYTVMRWFDKQEIRVLAKSLVPYANANGVTTSRTWATDVADTAWKLFAGQPHLSHSFLWDRHNDGATGAQDLLKRVPTGSYKRHIDRLARSLAVMISATHAISLTERLGASEKGSVLAGYLGVAESLGIATEDAGWSCPFYTAHLPRAISQLDPEALIATAE